jgi:hypothetical protein
MDLYEKGASGFDPERRLFSSDKRKAPSDWSRDGQFSSSHRMIPRRDGTCGHCGWKKGCWPTHQRRKWIRFERKVAYLTNGGSQPRWRRDGGELFYVSLDGKIVAVSVKTRPTFEPASWRRSSRPRFHSTSPIRRTTSHRTENDFITTKSNEGQTVVTLVLNWTAALQN